MSKKNKIKFLIGMGLLTFIVLATIIIKVFYLGDTYKDTIMIVFGIIGVISVILVGPYADELQNYNDKHKPPFAK